MSDKEFGILKAKFQHTEVASVPAFADCMD